VGLRCTYKSVATGIQAARIPGDPDPRGQELTLGVGPPRRAAPCRARTRIPGARTRILLDKPGCAD